MADAVKILSNKRLSLVNRKIECKRNYERQISEINGQIQDIDKALFIINDAISPYLCKVCSGTGTMRVTDAAGDVDDEICAACHGTGIDISMVTS